MERLVDLRHLERRTDIDGYANETFDYEVDVAFVFDEAATCQTKLLDQGIAHNGRYCRDDYGYARVLTFHESLDAQLGALKAGKSPLNCSQILNAGVGYAPKAC